MNQVDLLKYMKNHNLLALIGTPESLESAQELEKRGIVEKVGEFEGNPYYRISRAGEVKLGLSKESSIEAKKADAKERAEETVYGLLGQTNVDDP